MLVRLIVALIMAKFISSDLSALDIVVWDSHPLALGSTPSQVFIDGIPQLAYRSTVNASMATRPSPRSPNFDVEAALAVKYNGLPPLSHHSHTGIVVFKNLTSVSIRDKNELKYLIQSPTGSAVAVVDRGVIICAELSQNGCSKHFESRSDRLDISLEGGTLSPALVSFGPNLGLDAIAMEPSATDGIVDDILKPIARIAATQSIVKAADGLQFGTRDAL